MGDTRINYDEKFGIETFKRRICSELGEPFWLKLADGLALPCRIWKPRLTASAATCIHL